MLASEQKTYTGTAYNTYTFAYSYNLDGSLKSQTYPSGRVVDFTYDGSGRPSSVQEPNSGPSYLNSVAYAAHGGIDNLQLGNLLVEQTCYNDLLQPVARRLGDATSSGCAVQPSTDLLRLEFGYGAAATNNGNMTQQTIWAPDNGSGSAWQVTQDYTYDQVNRLATAAEKLSGVTQWSRTYSYDHFGNRWISGATGHTLHMATPTSSAAIQATTNRLTGTGITYDNAGNLTAHPHITPSGSMAYDANNKMTAFAATGVSVSTVYDATDRRVRKVHNSKTTVWVYDAFGKLAAEYTMEAHSDVGTYFRTTDHLGSTRLTTDDVGDVVARRDYFPFGERIDSNLSGRGSVVDGTLVSFNSGPGMRQQFTGQQRDDETGLDYFWARSYHGSLGRFLSSDPENAGALLHNPQLWNAYGYVSNNPLAFIDPNGKECYPAEGGGPPVCTNEFYLDIVEAIQRLIRGPAHGPSQVPADVPHECIDDPEGLECANYQEQEQERIRSEAEFALRQDINVVLDNIQLIIDVLGLIPSIGELADGTNVLIFLARGQEGDAAVSTAAMIPIVGSSGTSARILRRINQFLSDVPGGYLAGRAPRLVGVGIRRIEGQYIRDNGVIEPWVAYYDELGRIVAREDHTATGIHHHTFDYSTDPNGIPTDHIPGAYTGN